MGSPTVAANTPIRVELEADRTYWFCVCGRSNKQPYCDGSHQGSEFSPQSFEVDTAKAYFLCRCKQSDNTPFCDGTHNRIADDQVDGPTGD